MSGVIVYSSLKDGMIHCGGHMDGHLTSLFIPVIILTFITLDSRLLSSGLLQCERSAHNQYNWFNPFANEAKVKGLNPLSFPVHSCSQLHQIPYTCVLLVPRREKQRGLTDTRKCMSTGECSLVQSFLPENQELFLFFLS